MDKSTAPGPAEDILEDGNHANSSQNTETFKHQSFPYTSQSPGERRNYKRAANRGRKGSRVSASRNYPSRSSDSTARVLRSRSVEEKSPSDSVHTLIEKAAKNPPSDPVHTVVKPAAKKTKKGKPTKKSSGNEFSKIRQRVRYILNRMNYEQSLLEAYASEGWKRQSLEKIRPEKELERAKAEIVRCKLRIREAFQSLDHLLSVGKLQESLFDSEGKISCDDIVCSTCSTQDVTLNNDIILCDGVCDRGFHQNCLNPPLLTKDIPAGDEGWLCPACDCKIDCIDIINELQGTDLSIDDSWEKVFPEAAAVAHGQMQTDVPDLPSDDSEDDDFDPNIAEEHVAGHVEVSSEEDEGEDSDSDDSNFITSSDNSEHVKEKEKVDDLGLPSEDSEDDDYDPAGPDSDKDIKEKQGESDFTSDSDDCDQYVVLPSSGKQQDANQEAPFDSNHGEDLPEKNTPEKHNGKQSEAGSFVSQSNEFTPQSAQGQQSLHDLVNGKHEEELLTPNSLVSKGKYGPIIYQRLQEQFTADQYPSRAVKESLAQEVGLTLHQVNKWFDRKRHNTRVASSKNGTKGNGSSVAAHKVTDPETMVEKPDVGNSDAANEDMTSGILNKGIKQDGPLKRNIVDVLMRNVSSPNSSQRRTTTKGSVGPPKGKSRQDRVKNDSSSRVERPKDGDAEDVILALEAVDEKTKNSVLRELKKRKIG